MLILFQFRNTLLPHRRVYVHPPSLTRGGGMDLLKGGVLVNRIMKKIFINIYKFKDYSSELKKIQKIL